MTSLEQTIQQEKEDANRMNVDPFASNNPPINSGFYDFRPEASLPSLVMDVDRKGSIIVNYMSFPNEVVPDLISEEELRQFIHHVNRQRIFPRQLLLILGIMCILLLVVALIVYAVNYSQRRMDSTLWTFGVFSGLCLMLFLMIFILLFTHATSFSNVRSHLINVCQMGNARFIQTLWYFQGTLPLNKQRFTVCVRPRPSDPIFSDPFEALPSPTAAATDSNVFPSNPSPKEFTDYSPVDRSVSDSALPKNNPSDNLQSQTPSSAAVSSPPDTPTLSS